MLRPGDKTGEALNRAIEDQPVGAKYTWRCCGDDKVRAGHEARDGKVFLWTDSPVPGEEANCRCWAEAAKGAESNTKKLSSAAEARKLAILGKGKANFTLLPNPDANSNAPLYTLHFYNEVNRNDAVIKEQTKGKNVDPDLVRSIIYLETTQGYYDRMALGNETSIRPMNIKAAYWEGLGYNEKELRNPEINIEAGVKLLSGIENNMPDKTIKEIGTIYNNLGATKVSDYGVRLEKIYQEKPWQ